MSESVTTPGRPLPVFLNETSYSSRRRSTPFRAHHRTPRSPAKTCPPVSRVFRSSPYVNGGPQFVSFKSERKKSVESPFYSSSSHKSYFEQCFEVIEKLGEGSFGEVFKVRCRDDGRLYAVKRSRERFRGEWDRRRKLEEVEKQEALSAHPNCLRFLEAWEERGRVYIQMELCKMSLAEYADLNGRVSEDKVWDILIDLLQGLQHIHSNQLCHFDIKPHNIFLSLDHSFKLGDFGLCVSLEQGTRSAVEGDSCYMAPELMRGQFTKAADIFSLGISILEVSCDLELPSGGPNWHSLRNGELPSTFTKDLSPQLVHLLSQMMHTTLEERPTADELLQSSVLRRKRWRRRMRRGVNEMVLILNLIASPFRFVVLLIFSLVSSLWRRWRGRREGGGGGQSFDRRNPAPSTSDHTHVPSPPFIGVDDSFSDTDDEMIKKYLSTTSSDELSYQRSQLNCSWLNTSPVHYPSPLYSGPPIPLNLDISTTDISMEDSSPALKRSSLPPSQDSSFSCTPSSKPSLNEAVQLRSANKNVNIGPKNLMEMFGDVSD